MANSILAESVMAESVIGNSVMDKNTEHQYKLYQQALLVHHKSPVGFEKVIEVDGFFSADNPTCGDEITVQVQLSSSKEQVEQISFFGDSCAICRASASLLCEHLADKPTDEVSLTVKQLVLALNHKNTYSSESTSTSTNTKTNLNTEITLPPNFSALAVVQKFPVRKQCALLPWTTFEQALTLAQLNRTSVNTVTD